MNRLRILFVALFAIGAWLLPPEAGAVTWCTASLDNIRFDVRDPGVATTAQATLTYECTTLSSRDRAQVKLCLAIGAGATPGSTMADRGMQNSFGDDLAFQLYKDTARTNVWGADAAGATSRLEIALDYPVDFWGLFGYAQGSIPVYGLVAPQAGLAAGEYSSSFAAHTQLKMRYREWNGSGNGDGGLRSCDEGGTIGDGSTFTFTAFASVPDSCKVLTASDLDFSPGAPLTGTSTGVLDRTSAINLTCRKRTAWQVGLDGGLHPDGATRRMSNGNGALIRYQLNQNAGGTPWGDELNVNTKAADPASDETGAHSLTVYGHVPDQPLEQAGRYSDTIKVTVTY